MTTPDYADLREQPTSELEAIRVALREVGEDAVPPRMTTLAAVQWLIGEHQTLTAQNEELGAEATVLVSERDMLKERVRDLTQRIQSAEHRFCFPPDTHPAGECETCDRVRARRASEKGTSA